MQALVSAVAPRRLSPALERKIIAGALLYFGYVVATQFSGYVFTPPAILSPAAAIGLAVLFFEGLDLWPIIVLAVMTAGLINGSAFANIALMPFAHALQAIVGVLILRRLKFDPYFARLRDTFAFLAAAGLISFIVPCIGFVARYLTTIFSPERNLSAITWGSWWVGMFFSLTVVTPVILRFAANPRIRRNTFNAFEAALSLGLVVLLTILATWTSVQTIGPVPIAYPLLAALLWMAIRVGPRFMTLALFLFSIIAIGGVLFTPPHAATTLSLGQRLVTTEVSIIFFVVIYLAFTSLMEERKDATKALKYNLEKLKEAVSALEVRDHQRTAFLATLAHELRNPLSPVVSAVELLKLRQLVAPEGMSQLTLMEDRLGTIRRLLDDILEISRISSNKIKLQKGVVDLRVVLAQAIETVEGHLRGRKQQVLFTAPSTPILLSADAVRLEQVFTNLLHNASKFTEDGGSIFVNVVPKEALVDVSVRDNGIGIAAENLERIFEPFHQGTARVRPNDGLGVGLALSKSFVELHSGSIAVRSEGVGTGAEFIITLPLTADLVGEQRIVEEFPFPGMANGKKILVVDDNIAAARGIGALLEHRGYRVAYAENGEQSTKQLLVFEPEAVLLDIGLPDIDGYEVARLMREGGYTGTIIALTGYGQDEDKRRAFAAGFNTHLTKPVGFTELQKALHSPVS